MSSSEEEQQHSDNNSKDNEKSEKRKHSRDQISFSKRPRLVVDEKLTPYYNFGEEMDIIDPDLEDILYQKYAKKRKNSLMDERQRKYLRRCYILGESDSEEEEIYNDIYEYNPQLVYIFPLLNMEYTSFCV